MRHTAPEGLPVAYGADTLWDFADFFRAQTAVKKLRQGGSATRLLAGVNYYPNYYSSQKKLVGLPPYQNVIAIADNANAANG